MSSFIELARSRRSIRKFDDRDISVEQIQELIHCAVAAPSGCNSQCWKFVAVKDRTMINCMKDAVATKVEELLKAGNIELSEAYLASKRKMVGFFAAAPVVVAVFMTHLEYYDAQMISALKAQGFNDDEIMKLFVHPDLLSIGAAVQNILLAAHEKGFGACWMNEPAVAGNEIRKLLGEPESSKFISLIPIGYPSYKPRDKKLKDFDEVFSLI